MRQKNDIRISDDARVDIKFFVERGKVVKFAINVSVLYGAEIEDVFRVDTYHGRLHCQKFWISGGTIWLEDGGKADYTQEFMHWKKEVLENFQRWAKLYKTKREEGKLK